MNSRLSNQPILTVQDLKVEFQTNGVQRTALDRVSFQVFPAEVVGLLGESGSGKTTIGSTILGILPAEAQITGGSIKFRERELLGLNESDLQHLRGAEIALISQEPRTALNPVMTVGKQVCEVMRAHRSIRSSECRRTAMESLNTVNLEAAKIYDAYPHELSGGQCQRVAIAQALACNPRLIIADEPTSALDSTVQVEILDLIAGLRERLQTAFLLITHNPAILTRLADRVLIMKAGQIVEQGSATEVLRRPSHPYTRALLESRGKLLQSTSTRR